LQTEDLKESSKQTTAEETAATAATTATLLRLASDLTFERNFFM